jgi:hypothetical protein
MTVIKDIIQDLTEELTHLKKYENYPEALLSEITPLWWTDRYDGQFLAGFCTYNSELLRFQVIYSDRGIDVDLYILIKPTQEQLDVEQERIKDFIELHGDGRSFIGEKGKWALKPPRTGTNPQEFWNKHLDEKHITFKKQLDYSSNEVMNIFYTE